MTPYLGLISGTSADGVDAVVADFDDGPRLLARHSEPYPESLRQRILRVSQFREAVHPRELAALDHAVAEVFAQAAHAVGRDFSPIAAIGSHGQTLFHLPPGDPELGDGPPFTWQCGDPNRLAWLTGLPVVADFRRMDLAAGGQGAPLVPAFHHACFAHPTENRVILNIGGIANLTVLPANDGEVLGYDTGPGNGLMDAWISLHQGQPFDAEGQWAAQGEVQAELLETWRADPYFALPYPKSTGRDYFHLAWLGQPNAAPQDVQATLLALTVETIVTAIQPHHPTRVLVCGGGARNAYLMQKLQAALDSIPVTTTEPFGLPPDWVEAACFAWLARERLADRSGCLPTVTGAASPVILGGVYRAK